MKDKDIKRMSLMNRDAAELFINIDKTQESETGQSMLGKTRPFLQQVLDDTRDSTIPGAFNAVLNQRLTGQAKSASLLK